MTDLTLDTILAALEDASQRATYGAVASVLGKTPRTLMKGRTRDAHHSWVVNRNTGKPTGYEAELLHPALEQNPHIIDAREELESWLLTTVHTG